MMISDRAWRIGFHAAAFVIAALCLLFAVWNVNWPSLFAKLRMTDATIAAEIGALFLAAYLLRALRWRSLYRQSGEIVPYWPLFHATMIGYLGNSFLPARAGDAMRMVWAARGAQLSLPRVLGTIVSERVLDFVALALVVSLGGTLSSHFDNGFARAATLLGLVAFAILLAMIFFPDTVQRAALRLMPKNMQADWRERISRWMDQILASGRVFRRKISLYSILALTVSIWILDSAGLLLAGRAVMAEIGFPAALLLCASLGLSTSLPSTPGYIGIFQAVTIAVLSPFGVSREGALALILLYQGISYILICLFGINGLLVLESSRYSKQDGERSKPVGKSRANGIRAR